MPFERNSIKSRVSQNNSNDNKSGKFYINEVSRKTHLQDIQEENHLENQNEVNIFPSGSLIAAV